MAKTAPKRSARFWIFELLESDWFTLPELSDCLLAEHGIYVLHTSVHSAIGKIRRDGEFVRARVREDFRHLWEYTLMKPKKGESTEREKGGAPE